jgi:membrane carboxypeptidase/penicillin-binding protein PbpC
MPCRLGLSMALGTGEMSPMKLAEGYAVFANGGFHVTPYFIQRIETADGRVVFRGKRAAFLLGLLVPLRRCVLQRPHGARGSPQARRRSIPASRIR